MLGQMILGMHGSVIRERRILHEAVLVFLVFLVLAGVALAQSGFHRFVDENGQVRYTDNPANVPPDQYRDLVNEGSAQGVETDITIQEPQPSGAQRIVINYDSRGGTIFVHAVLDHHLPVVFQLDTGATQSMITESDARLLNISLESTKSLRSLIADGSIVELPVVRLASIGLGEALVEGLEVTVGKLRLLGMDFLENFELHINSQQGQLVLVAKDSGLGSRGLKPESDLVRQDRQQAKRDIDNKISQLKLMIKTSGGLIERYRDDIEEAEMKLVEAESALSGTRNQTRFQSSGVSREKWKESAISRIEKNIVDLDAYIQNHRNLIKLQEEKVAGMQSQINHMRRLRSRIN